MIKLTDGRPWYKQVVSGVILTILLLIALAMLVELWKMVHSTSVLAIMTGFMGLATVAGVTLYSLWVWSTDS